MHSVRPNATVARTSTAVLTTYTRTSAVNAAAKPFVCVDSPSLASPFLKVSNSPLPTMCWWAIVRNVPASIIKATAPNSQKKQRRTIFIRYGSSLIFCLLLFLYNSNSRPANNGSLTKVQRIPESYSYVTIRRCFLFIAVLV